jgi:2-polyprenyl-3-methyl-5-hydroxy-6-metoxy-1,4-benzoquinol methylase
MAASVAYVRRRPAIRHTLKKHLPQRGGKLLDAGCGTGDWLIEAAQLGWDELCGIERKAESAAIAKERTTAVIIHDDIQRAVNGMPEAEWDAILAIDILEHLPKDQVQSVLAGFRRILRPGGVLTGRVPNAEGIFGMAERYGDDEHEQAFEKQRLYKMLERAGFNENRIFEDPPVVFGVRSALRRLIWETGTLLFRLLKMAEDGTTRSVLTRNMQFTVR